MWRWIKIPKAVALLAFLLPWMSVSCSNNRLVSATGFGLTFGRFSWEMPSSRVPSSGDWNLWLLIALVAIVIGLAVTFLRRHKAVAALSLGMSATALAFIWLGTSRYSKAALLEQASKGRSGVAGGLEQAAASVITVNWHYGLWLAVSALIAAAVMAALVFSGRDADLVPPR